jgi:hypothetical protein
LTIRPTEFDRNVPALDSQLSSELVHKSNGGGWPFELSAIPLRNGVIGVVAWTFVGLVVLMSANGAEVEGASTLLQQDGSELSDVRKLPMERIDTDLAARLLAFAGIGRDRCGLGPFPTWALINGYGLRDRDFKVTSDGHGGDGSIGPYYQLMLDAEDEAARMLGDHGVSEGCRLIRNELSRHVKIDD